MAKNRLFFNWLSRGAYSVRVLGGLLYMAAISGLRAKSVAARAIIGHLFEAHKASTGNVQWIERIRAVYARHGLGLPTGQRGAGYLDRITRAVVEAMTMWDNVQAPSLDDSRADSFTPILAGGVKATSG